METALRQGWEWIPAATERCLPENSALHSCEQPQVWGSYYLKQTLAFGSTFSSQNETNPETELICDLQNFLTQQDRKQTKERNVSTKGGRNRVSGGTLPIGMKKSQTHQIDKI